MGIKQSIFQVVGNFYFDRPSKKQSYDEWIVLLHESGKAVEEAASKAEDTEKNRDQMAHIIGIERWAKARLNAFAKGERMSDEYDSYRPDSSFSLQRLRKEWQNARKESISAIRRLEAKDVNNRLTQHHDDFGDLSVGGWAHYMAKHAKMEAKRLK